MKKTPRTQRPRARNPDTGRQTVSTGKGGGAVTSASYRRHGSQSAWERSRRGAARPTGAALHELGRALVPRRLHLRRDRGGRRGRRGARHRRARDGGHEGVRRRVLEPDPLHHADGVRHHRRLRRRDLAARAAADRPAGPAAQDRPRCRRLHRHREHARLAAELGPQPDLRRALGPRRGAAGRPARGLPRRGCRSLSRARRHLGPGPELLRGPAPGQCREPAQDAAADHRRDPVHRDHLPLAVHGHRRSC